VSAWTHMAPRLAPGGVQIEIHYAVRGLGSAEWVFERAAPIAEMQGLWMPSPEDHLFHLLWHGSVKHPGRHGRIRDLLLLKYTVERSSAADRERLERRVGADPDRDELAAVMQFVSGWPARELTDPFCRTAALRYLIHALPAVQGLPKRMERYL